MTNDVFEVMRTARAVRRFRPDPVDEGLLARCLEAATWAPSGSNEQPWRFVVIADDDVKAVVAGAYRAGWDSTAAIYGLTRPTPEDRSRRARMTRSMFDLVEHAADVPAFVLFCVRPTPGFPDLLAGGSIFPALENFLLAARAVGLGAVVSSWFTHAEDQLRSRIAIPDGWEMAAIVAVGWPVGGHGPVRRRPVAEVTARDRWDRPLIGDDATSPLPRRRSTPMPPLDARSLVSVLNGCADREPDHVALAQGDDMVLRGELFDQARQAGGFLAGFGLDAPVAFMLDDHLDHARLIAGLCLAGGVQVPINTAYRGELLAHVLADAGVATLVTEARYVSRIAQIAHRCPSLQRIIVRGGVIDTPLGIDVVPLDGIAEAPGCDPAPRAPQDLYGIMYTSGTTGVSKGVLTTHGHAYAYASPAGLGAVEPGETSLVVMPLCHVSGQLWGVFNALMADATAALAGGFSASRFWEEVRHHQATFTTLAGAMARFLQRNRPAATDAEHTLRRVCIAPIPADVGEFCARFGIETYCTGYGSTESGSPLGSPSPRPSGSIGWPRPEWSARVVDDDDRDVPDGELGELVIRPEEPWVMMSGYHGRPDATANAWRNGWFHTGDGARRSPAGEFFLVDRVRDVIRRRGENISASEVEAVLAGAPAVAQVAVVGVASADSEQEVMAAVVPDCADYDPATLVAHARSRLPYFMVPRYVQVLDELPLTDTGKVRKQHLRDAGTDGAWDRERAGIRVSRHDA